MTKIISSQSLPQTLQDDVNQLASKRFSIQTPWHNGDCEIAGPDITGALTGPTLELFPNGTGVFSANCRSTDTNDTLGVAFSFDDANGNQVYHAPHVPGMQPDPDAGHFSFFIGDQNTWKPCQINFTFDAALYNTINKLRPWYQC